jgi:hypothetical protein
MIIKVDFLPWWSPSNRVTPGPIVAFIGWVLLLIPLLLIVVFWVRKGC